MMSVKKKDSLVKYRLEAGARLANGGTVEDTTGRTYRVRLFPVAKRGLVLLDPATRAKIKQIPADAYADLGGLMRFQRDAAGTLYKVVFMDVTKPAETKDRLPIGDVAGATERHAQTTVRVVQKLVTKAAKALSTPTQK